MKTQHPDPSALEYYKTLPRKYGQLIPLHKWDYVDSKGRERGKSPKDAKWVSTNYDKFDAAAHMENGYNVGLRPTPALLIIDVDMHHKERNGRESFKELITDLGIDEKTVLSWPCVETGSGGLHYYVEKDPDIVVRDSLEGYPGVEFKSFGRQVVAAGSKHPNGKLYLWDFLSNAHQDMSRLPFVPKKLMALIGRTDLEDQQATGAGEFDQEELAEMLSGIEVLDFNTKTTQDDGKSWMDIMMACHHATAGDGRSEFIEWSTQDPDYADQAWDIGRRWDSLSANRKGGRTVTYKYLLKLLYDQGKGHLIPNRRSDSPDEDFARLEDLEWEKKKTQGDLPGRPGKDRGFKLLEDFNEKYFTVKIGKAVEVGWFMEEDTGDPSGTLQTLKVNDFRTTMCNQIVTVNNKGDTKPLANLWLEWAKRRDYSEGLVFMPHSPWSKPPASPRLLNTWKGFAYEPVKPDGGKYCWDLLRDGLIRDVICDGNPATYEYVLDWLAAMVQYPDRRAPTMLVIRGAQGTGKSTLGEMVMALCGTAAAELNSPEQLLGQFTDRLDDKIFILADEVSFTGAKTSQEMTNALKNLLSSQYRRSRRMYQPETQVPNTLHIMLTTNESSPVLYGTQERRFLALKANRSRQQDNKFFSALRVQMADGGFSAMLHDLLLRDVNMEALRLPPETDETADQKFQSLPPMLKWLADIVVSGELPFETVPRINGGGPDWNKYPMRASTQDVLDAYKRWCEENRIRVGMQRSTLRGFANELTEKTDGLIGSTTLMYAQFSDEFLEQYGLEHRKGEKPVAALSLPSRTELQGWIEKEVGREGYLTAGEKATIDDF
jgi:hypothetical protein